MLSFFIESWVLRRRSASFGTVMLADCVALRLSGLHIDNTVLSGPRINSGLIAAPQLSGQVIAAQLANTPPHDDLLNNHDLLTSHCLTAELHR